MMLANRLAALAVVFLGVLRTTQGLQQIVEATCSGSDNSVPAKCFLNGTSLATTLPLAYERSRAVLRLHNAKATCTGFLVGSEGHVMTAQQCIPTAEDAATTVFEFGAESASCEEQCLVRMGCAGAVLRTTSEFITSSDMYPYTLVKLAWGEDIAQYGYLQLGRSGGAKPNDNVYIPGHPGASAKRIAAYTTGGAPASIQALYVPDACGRNSITHTAFMIAGSVGSPVLSWSDNFLLGLNTCSDCNTRGGFNTATDIRKVNGDLNGKSIKIKDFQFTTPTEPPPTTAAPPPTSTTTAPPPTTTTPPPTTTAPPPTTTAPPPTTTAPPPTTTAPPPTTTAPPPTTTTRAPYCA